MDPQRSDSTAHASLRGDLSGPSGPPNRLPPITTPEIEAIVAHFEYKPGWGFAVEEGDEGLMMVITLLVEDTYNRGSMQLQKVRSYLPPFFDSWQLLSWLRWRIGRIELHERDEWIVYYGRIIFDPHEREDA